METKPTLTTTAGTIEVPDGVQIDPVRLGWKRVETGVNEPPVFVQEPAVIKPVEPLPQIPDIKPVEAKALNVALQPLNDGTIRTRFPLGISSIAVNGKPVSLKNGSQETWFGQQVQNYIELKSGDTITVTKDGSTYTVTVPSNAKEQALTLSTATADMGNPPTQEELDFTGNNETVGDSNPQDWN